MTDASGLSAVFFDLDGTLLPMDMDKFISCYFGALIQKAAPLGYSGETLTKALWGGVEAMVKNDGTKTNEERFWEAFEAFLGDRILQHKGLFEEFYAVEFAAGRKGTWQNPLAIQLVKTLLPLYPVVVATNPIFPLTAQHLRMEWAGLDPRDMTYISSYENSHFCKPNTAYYAELTEKLSLDPARVLMIGNDAREDLPAASLGMSVFLLTDCALHTEGVDLSATPHGSFLDLISFMKEKKWI